MSKTVSRGFPKVHHQRASAEGLVETDLGDDRARVAQPWARSGCPGNDPRQIQELSVSGKHLKRAQLLESRDRRSPNDKSQFPSSRESAPHADRPNLRFGDPGSRPLLHSEVL